MTSNDAPPVATRIALARALYRALAEGDRRGLGSLLHDRFEGVTTDGLPEGLGGTHVGPTDMRRNFWGRIGVSYDARAEPSDFRALADGGLLVLGRYQGEAREGGGELDAAFAHVLDFEGDRIVRLEQVTDSHRWHEALPSVAPAVTEAGVGPVLRCGVVDGVATLRLNRPDRGNSFDLALAVALDEATATITRDPEVRSILLVGEGPMFSAGGDIGVFAAAEPGRLGATLERMTDHYHAAVARLSECDAPVVCAVRGAAAGGGLGLVCVADLVIAADDSRFVVGYDRLGLTSDGGTTWALPRLVGLRRAQRFYLEGRPWGAQEALEAGLVTRLVPDADVEQEALAAARRLAAGPTAALGHVRRLLRSSFAHGSREGLRAEQRSLVAVADGPDATEGIAAFTAKRAPTFQGR